MPRKKTILTLVNAPDDKCFWTHDGRILRNLENLYQVLGEMSNEAFSYHVNPEKNDFAKWIEEVLGDRVLAKQLRKVKTKRATLKRIEQRLKKYRLN